MSALSLGLMAAVMFFVAKRGWRARREKRQRLDAAEFNAIGQRDPRPAKGEVPYLQEQAIRKKAQAITRDRRRARLEAQVSMSSTATKAALPFRKAGAA